MEIKKYLYLLIVVAWFFIGCSSKDDPKPPTKPETKTVAERLAEAPWETRVLSEGVVWKYHHFEGLFSSNQSVTIIDVDLNNKDLNIDIPFVTSGFLKTSEAGKATRAIVAINGSYFDTSKGGSTVFFRKNGDIISHTRTGFTTYRENAGFAIDSEGGISIVKKPAQGWTSLNMSTVLASGPLLIFNNEAIQQVDAAFNNNRHPRTSVGITKDNHLIAAVVDGRTSQAHGVSIAELTEVMHALGCTVAMNLDGGGSSTAYVQNRGVVNYPSDNNVFDHEGERGVATVIVFEINEDL